jgi:uncharacterized protein (DUF1800 family)
MQRVIRQSIVNLVISALLFSMGSPIFASLNRAKIEDRAGIQGENPAAAGQPADTKAAALSERQKILHVLNRLGYGPRPGDVERVQRMGISAYIEQQLNPEKIDDSVAEAKVNNLEVFNLSTSELFAKYPNPGALLRQLEGPQAAQKIADRKNDNAAKSTESGSSQMNSSNGTNAPDQDAQKRADEQAQKERRQRLMELYREYNLKPAGQIMPQVVTNRFVRAVYSERQLQEVMVDFWANHFNVFSGKGAVRWFIPSYERDVLRKYALGNFQDLLLATAQHPAMLFYLDNFESIAPNSNNNNRRMQQMISGGNLPPRVREQMKARLGVSDAELDKRLEQMRQVAGQRRGLNENYARELMELHTLGVNGGYTQKDVIEVAKAFTGWTIADARGYRRAAAAMIKGEEDKRLNRIARQAGIPDNLDSGEFYFNPRWHDNGPKYILGQKIDEGGMKDGLKVIEILAHHPSTAKFIARKLCVKFVNDEPSDQLVNRVADAFLKSGGDIKSTLRAIFNSPEFFAIENYRAKIKTPFELAVSTVRALGGDTVGGQAMFAMLNKLGEVPYGYQAPTGYPDKAENWVNTGALLERLNFAIAVASNRIPGTRVDLTRFSAADNKDILDKAIATILNGEISESTRRGLDKQLASPLPDVTAGAEPMDEFQMTAAQGQRANNRARLQPPTGNPEVFKVVSLVLGTPEFQRQ